MDLTNGILPDKNIFYLKSKFGSSWSAVVVIKSKKNIILIDSGPKSAVENEILPWFKKNDIDLDDIYIIINTHSHGDHIGANHDLKKLNKSILIASHRLAVKKIKDPYNIAKKIRDKFSDYTTTPSPDKINGVDIDISLEDKSIIEIEGLKLNILHTPGHDTDCICIYEPETKTLFSGDSIQGGGTKSSCIAFYQDVTSYKKSLKKIKALEIENLVLGHPYYPSNGIIRGKSEVAKFLEISLKYINIYEREIFKILVNNDKNVLEIAKELINKVGINKNPTFIFPALYTVNTHISKI